jgi:hypothetical protein
MMLEAIVQFLSNSQSFHELLRSCLRPGVTSERILDVIRNEVNNSENRLLESPILSKLPLFGAKDENANPNSNSNNTGVPTSSTNIDSGLFGTMNNSLTNNAFIGMQFGYHVPNYADTLAQYPKLTPTPTQASLQRHPFPGSSPRSLFKTLGQWLF